MAKKLYGGETEKAVNNFPISGETVPLAVIHWLGRIKGAAARVNGELGKLDEGKAQAIAAAAAEVAAGRHDDQFPIDVFQTGSGTSTNTNVNEVLANLSGRARQRPREHGAVLQRRVPQRRAPGRARPGHDDAAARAQAAREVASRARRAGWTGTSSPAARTSWTRFP